jgi:putative nucleotidyltransferase with HDIG domain
LIMQSVGYAHQYLAKPCDPDVLRSAISRSLALKNLLSNPRLHGLIADIKALPTPPALYDKLVAELQSEESSAKTVAEIIASDIAMTAKLLQVVNSAFFGMPTRVESALRAVNLLGLDTVRALVLTVGIFAQSETNPLGGISVDSIYSHSLAVGAAAKRLARALGLDARQSDDALMAGMMHDIGILISLTHLRKEMKGALDMSRTQSINYRQAEIEVMGVSHAELGAHLLSIWGLPDIIVEAVAFHHNPNDGVNKSIGVLTAVHLANAFLPQLGNDQESPASLHDGYVSRLGLEARLSELRECRKSE